MSYQRTLCLTFHLLIGIAIGNTPSKPAELSLGLITDGYGIVMPQDIKKNLETAYPTRKLGGKIKPFLVWQCLPLDEVKLSCHDLGYDEDIKSRMVDATFQVISRHQLFFFFTPHAVEWSECKGFKRSWKKLLRKGQIACFSAYYLDDDPVIRTPYKRHSSWRIDRIKSHYGKWSLFRYANEPNMGWE